MRYPVRYFGNRSMRQLVAKLFEVHFQSQRRGFEVQNRSCLAKSQPGLRDAAAMDRDDQPDSAHRTQDIHRHLHRVRLPEHSQ